MKPRDEAIRLSITLLRPLFRWTHLAWTPTHDKAVARIVECIIVAAAERGARLALERLDEQDPDDHVAELQRLLGKQERPTQPLEPRPYNDRPQDIYDARTLLQRQNGAEQ